MKTMNILAKRGDKVVFMNNGTVQQKNEARAEGLKEGETYTVNTVDIGGWDELSYVTLFEVMGKHNTVMFSDAADYTKPEPLASINVGADDQMFQAVSDMVKIAKKHYDECIKAGFTVEQSFRMTLDLQKSIIKGDK